MRCAFAPHNRRERLAPAGAKSCIEKPTAPRPERLPRSNASKECPALRATKRRRGATTMGRSMDVLVIDVGGTHVKILATGQTEKREFDSGPKMTAQQMVAGVR